MSHFCIRINFQRMMDAHQGQSSRCVELGNQLINNEHFAASEIQKNVSKLENLWSSVEEEWNRRKQLLEQGLGLQVCLKFSCFIWILN